MSISINRTILGGNLTRNPEIRFLANEQAVANFGLAINRRFKGNDGQMKDEVTFIDVEAWGRTAELVGQYLTKGRSCLVEGRLKLDVWDDKDGQKRTKLKVVAESVQFLDSGNRGGERSATPTDDADNLNPAPQPKPNRTAPTPASAQDDFDSPPF